jgi:2-phosphoglycolate phosphatase
MSLRAVLLDFDGTLADTAPDLSQTLNMLCQEAKMPTLYFSQCRALISQGAAGMIRAALKVEPEHAKYPRLLERFHAHYETYNGQRTLLFPGVLALLDGLERRALPWGIVTNKAERFTLPLLSLLGLEGRPACIICGDTTANPKPHPEPLLLAAKRLKTEPEHCLYLGDDLRDITAAKAAQMHNVAATYGYLSPEDDPDNWDSDYQINHPVDLLAIIDGLISPRRRSSPRRTLSQASA